MMGRKTPEDGGFWGSDCFSFLFFFLGCCRVRFVFTPAFGEMGVKFYLWVRGRKGGLGTLTTEDYTDYAYLSTYEKKEKNSP